MNQIEKLTKLAGFKTKDEYSDIFDTADNINPGLRKKIEELKAKQEEIVQEEAAHAVMEVLKDSAEAIERERKLLSELRIRERSIKARIHAIAVLREYGNLSMDYTMLHHAVNNSCINSTFMIMSNPSIDKALLNKAIATVEEKLHNKKVDASVKVQKPVVAKKTASAKASVSKAS